MEVGAIPRTGASPLWIVRTESAPKEVGEAASVFNCRDLVVVVLEFTTNGQQDLDAHVTALLEAIHQRRTVFEELGFVAILAVNGAPAVASKVGTRVASGLVVLGRLIDKTDRDGRDSSAAVVCRVVGCPLTLETERNR